MRSLLFFLPVLSLPVPGLLGQPAPPAARITLFGATYEADGIFLCVNRSVFPDFDARFGRFITEAIRILQVLPQVAEFGFVFFDEGTAMFPSSGIPATAQADEKQAAYIVLRNLEPGGTRSCTEPALLDCLSMAEKSTAPKKLIVFLSDGHHDCPGTASEADPAEILAAVKAANTAKVPIHALVAGWSPDLDQDWMRELALENEGSYSIVEPRLFRRGDTDEDGTVALTDPVSLLDMLFLGDVVLACSEAADADDSGALEVTDAVLSLSFQFLGGAPPAPPGPTACGPDPNPPFLGCYTRCR